MAQNLDQKIAEAEARLARLREESRKKKNSQKILLGGMLINAARKNPKIRQWLLEEAERSITRDVDKKRLEPLLDTLRSTPESQPENRAEILSDTASINE